MTDREPTVAHAATNVNMYEEAGPDNFCIAPSVPPSLFPSTTEVAFSFVPLPNHYKQHCCLL